jgi:hypothetical protein
MAYAKGKYSYVTSDRSGVRYLKRDVRREWNGFIVGKDEYEPKHPQLTPPASLLTQKQSGTPEMIG